MKKIILALASVSLMIALACSIRDPLGTFIDEIPTTQNPYYFNFETSLQGWQVGGNGGTAGGVRSLVRSSAKSKEGSYSLKMHCEFTDTSATNNSGMAGAVLSGVNLTNKPVISMWLWIPLAAFGADPTGSNPNMIQIFVKTGTGLSWFADTVELSDTTKAGIWAEYSIDISAAPGGTASVGEIGVKFLCGGGANTTAFSGDIYIDAVKWLPEPAAGNYIANYTWEDGSDLNWVPETWTSDQGFNVPPAPVNSSEKAWEGTKSLKCHLVLTQGSVNFTKGVMWVDLPNATTDLTNTTISAWIWLTNGLYSASNPYGVQFTFKDTAWNYCNLTWNNITNTSSGWRKFSTRISSDNFNYNAGCDLKSIRQVGIQIAPGTGDKFDGYVWLDKVSITN